MIDGFKIFVSPDHPKMQLGEGFDLMAGDFVTPECRRETNAWLAEFFGYYNLISDDQAVIMKAANSVWMNPRTAAKLRTATPQGKI